MQGKGVGENSIPEKQGSLSRPPEEEVSRGLSALSGTGRDVVRKGRQF